MKTTINKDVIVYEENSEIILINMMKNNFYALDSLGSVIWKKIYELKSEELTSVIDYIHENFDVDREIVENDISEFITALEKIGVLKIHA
ncbi:MAG: PqqD family protein [Bacillota bacterium]